MNNLLTEYNTVKKRIEQVGDYHYAVDLKKKVADNKLVIKENEKKIKEMEQDQKKRDIKMNRMIKEEKSEKMRRVDYKHSRLTYLQDKINEMEEKIEQLNQEKQEKDIQEKEVKQKYESMLKIGEHYGITEKNIENEEEIFRNKLMDEYELVIRKEKFLKQEMESIEKQYKMEIKEKKKMIKEYTDKKKNASKELSTVVQDILSKAQQLDGLIEKMRGFGMGEDILNKWSEENKELISTNQVYNVDDIEDKIKESLPPPKPKKKSVSPAKKTVRTNKAPMPQKKIIETKPSLKNKPFGIIKKPTDNTQPIKNISQDNIKEEVPEVIEEKQEEIKSKAPMKPFDNMNTKNKATFGKFGKPFGNAVNSGQSVNSSVIEDKLKDNQNQKEPEKLKDNPVSFTEKYGLSNKDISQVEEPSSIQPLNQNSGQRKMNNAPWMKNKPALEGNANNNSSATGGYIPTMGGGSNGPRRVGQNTTEGNEIGTLPKKVGMNSGRSNMDNIPMIGSSNNDPIDNIPMMGSSNRDPVDNIPTMGDKNINEVRGRVRETENS